MQIQVVTFHVDGAARAQFDRYSGSFELALKDMPGCVSTICLEGSGDDLRGGVAIWEDAPALAAFRHSELYARLAMSPLVDDFEDRDMAVLPRTELELALVS